MRLILVTNKELSEPFKDLDIYELLVISDSGHIYSQNKPLAIKTFPPDYFEQFSKDTNRSIIQLEQAQANFNSEAYHETCLELVRNHIDVVSFITIKKKVYNKDIRQEFNMDKREVDGILTRLIQIKLIGKDIASRYYITDTHKEMVQMELNNYRG